MDAPDPDVADVIKNMNHLLLIKPNYRHNNRKLNLTNKYNTELVGNVERSLRERIEN